MRPEQAQAAARLGGRAAGGVVTHVEHVHRSIATRVLAPLEPSSPERVAYDTVTRLSYGTVRAALKAAGTTGGVVARLASHGREDDLAATGWGNHAVSALNAVIGETLSRDNDPLAIKMGVRRGGQDVDVTRDGLAAAWPEATPRLAVFVHGLGENDDSWRRHSTDDTGSTYGSRLATEFGYTPLYLRYNTGRHVSDNGRDLATLLHALHENWPTTVDEMLLVGHSMGGLVIRAACHYGSGEPWTDTVRHIVYLGAPHTGAPLARGARMLAWAFDKTPETRPYGRLADHSAGVRDLRFGYLVDEDWAECDAGTCRQDHAHDVPLLATADHYVISAAVASDPSGPTARVVGDLLVQPSSAHGRRHNRTPVAFEHEHIAHISQLHHFDLLNHPAVYDTLRSWLAGNQVGTAARD